MAQKKTKNELSNAQKIGIGVGLTAAAVAAAGTYFLYGSKSAPKNRQKVKSWVLKAKGEVLEALEKAEHITEEEYRALVEVVGGAYSTMQNVSKNEIKDFKKEMNDHWVKIKKSGAAAKVVSVAKKMTKPVVKKVAKKAPAKKAPQKKAVPKKVAKKAPTKEAS